MMSPGDFFALFAQQIPEARPSWRHGAEALFFLGIAYGLIKWVGRTLREISGSDADERETAFVASAMRSVTDSARVNAFGGESMFAEVTEARPARGGVPAIAVLVHCPGCGAALTAEPYPVPFFSTCDSCGRRISVRGDGTGRVSVVVEERR